MFGRGVQDRMVGKATRGTARGAGKTALGTGKVLFGGRRRREAARQAARGVGKAPLKGGKAQAKLAKRALSSREPASARYLKYGFFALTGFAVGALVARLSGEKEVSSSFTGTTGRHTPDTDSLAGQRGETWGSGTPLGTAGGGPAGDASATGVPSDPARPQRPEDPNRTGAEREYSDPSSGPLIGRRPGPGPVEIPEQQEEVENRIRTRIGEDPRTAEMPRVNVEVNDGVAELRGEAPSEEAKEAAGEITSNIEGVREVRNLLTVNPEAPTRRGPGDEPDLPPPRTR
jgi:hypothetical protein